MVWSAVLWLVCAARGCTVSEVPGELCVASCDGIHRAMHHALDHATRHAMRHVTHPGACAPRHRARRPRAGAAAGAPRHP
eukprot:scaffold104993_cov82-Phaeocystis_antarctica.AAC.3